MVMSDNNITAMGIRVDDGRRRVPITNVYGDEVGVFYFNPTDINIIERYNNVIKRFDTVLEPLENMSGTGKDDINLDAINEAKERLFSAVNEMFGGDMAGAFFGDINPFSPVDGKFYCEVVIEAVGKYISEQFKKETETINSRVEKYTSKYKKRK